MSTWVPMIRRVWPSSPHEAIPKDPQGFDLLGQSLDLTQSAFAQIHDDSTSAWWQMCGLRKCQSTILGELLYLSKVSLHVIVH